MKTLLLILVSISVVIFSACKKPTLYPIAVATTTSPCQVLDTFNLKDSAKRVRDAFQIVSDTVIGNDLKLTVAYNGGCKTHDFNLVWNQYSMTAMFNIILFHNSNGDTLCVNKKPMTQDLCFDISLLKKNTGVAHGMIQFPLVDTYSKSVMVKYYY